MKRREKFIIQRWSCTFAKPRKTCPHSKALQKSIPSDTEKIARFANRVYVAIADEVLNRRSMHLRNFVLNGQESASNPLLHIHANRQTV